MIQRKKLILGPLFLAVAALVVLAIVEWKTPQVAPTKVEIIEFPTLGNFEAKVEVLLFEDLCCSGCQYFSQVIYPQIESTYINSGKVRYRVVPLAFLDHSKERANAAWAVFKQNPSQFFPYVQELFQFELGEEIKPPLLIATARKIGKIDLERLDECIQSGCYYEALERNMQWAQKIMRKNFGTPALFVNGNRTSIRSFEIIQKQIERSLLE